MTAGRTYQLRDRSRDRCRRAQGINRIGNLLVPNRNYCLFEDWLTPLLDEMLEEQKASGTFFSPQKMIWKMGERINDDSSVLTWAWRNRVRRPHSPRAPRNWERAHARWSPAVSVVRWSSFAKTRLPRPLTLRPIRLGGPDPHLLPRNHRRLHRRHDLLPLVHQPGPRHGHRPGPRMPLATLARRQLVT
jgi:hypothetical protein